MKRSSSNFGRRRRRDDEPIDRSVPAAHPIAARQSASAVLTVTRATLYREVWAEPLAPVGRRYGLSAVGLMRLCDRHEVPRPEFGHWARVWNGHTVEQPPLPQASTPALETIEISTRWGERRALRERMRADPESGGLLARDEAAAPFEVRATLRATHDLVRRRPRTRIEARSDCPRESVAEKSVHVSEPHLSRALRVLDALLRGLDQRGFGIDGSTGSLRVSVLNVEFALRVREYLRPSVHCAALSQSVREVSTWEYSLRGYGELELQVWVRNGGGRRRWHDTTRHLLDDCLSQVPAALIELAFEERERRVDERRRDEHPL